MAGKDWRGRHVGLWRFHDAFLRDAPQSEGRDSCGSTKKKGKKKETASRGGGLGSDRAEEHVRLESSRCASLIEP